MQRSYLETVQSNGLRLLEADQQSARPREDREPAAHGPAAAGARGGDVRRGSSTARGRSPSARACGSRWRRSTSCPRSTPIPEAFEKILVNLLGNALKFTERGGAIRVQGVREGRDGVHLVVADTGDGHSRRISSSGSSTGSPRWMASNTRKFEGTGIGLALVKELVELHGGRVWAASEGLGRGAQMHVVLPAGRERRGGGESDAVAEAIEDESGELRPALRNAIAGMGAELREAGGPGGAIGGIRIRRLRRRLLLPPYSWWRWSGTSSGTTRICAWGVRPAVPELPPGTPEVLVVEDNVDMRRLLHHLVGQEFRVRLARDGREGLAAVRERAPDLVLTDVMMPEHVGHRAVRGDQARSRSSRACRSCSSPRRPSAR